MRWICRGCAARVLRRFCGIHFAPKREAGTRFPMACSGSDEGDDRGDRGPQAAREEPPTRPTRQAAISWEIQRRGDDQAALIEELHQVQLQEGHLSPGALDQVARELRLPLSRVYGVAAASPWGRCGPGGACWGLTERLGPGLRASPDRRAHSSH